MGLEVSRCDGGNHCLQRRLTDRKVQPYDKYDEVEFDIPVGKNGDCCELSLSLSRIPAHE